MFTVISAIAECERSLISECLRAGIVKARANGKPHRRPTTDERSIQEIRRRRQGESLNAIARHLGVSQQTVANYAPQRRNDSRHR
jgi:DNA invertase Pin-like site-specific DNA recombinase